MLNTILSLNIQLHYNTFLPKIQLKIKQKIYYGQSFCIILCGVDQKACGTGDPGRFTPAVGGKGTGKSLCRLHRLF
jgi:hypothetical protein